MNIKLLNMGRRLVAAVFAVLTMGVFGSPQAVAAGITDTRHNLGTTAGNPGVNKFGGTAEICVFCHTPHGADTSAAVPLWNRKLAAASSYTTYNSLGTSSLDGATAPVGSVSLACLSCHDGTQAMNVMINQPGSGGYVAAGSALAGTWSGANQTLGKINAGITNIDTDLKNDHPIGIQYGGGMVGGGAFSTSAMLDATFKDADFKGVGYANLNGQPVWWVDTGTTGRQKTDMQLYTRTGADSVNLDGSLNAGAITGAQAFVECASCHDPHTTSATFLRISNAGSAVCLSCHIK